MTTKQASTVSANEERKCLVESGKVIRNAGKLFSTAENDVFQGRKRCFLSTKTTLSQCESNDINVKIPLL